MLMWDNAYYTSSDPYRPPVILSPMDNSAEPAAVSSPQQPFIYVAGVMGNFLHIGRLQMPDFATANIKWDGALFSPKRSHFFNGIIVLPLILLYIKFLILVVVIL